MSLTYTRKRWGAALATAFTFRSKEETEATRATSQSQQQSTTLITKRGARLRTRIRQGVKKQEETWGKSKTEQYGVVSGGPTNPTGEQGEKTLRCRLMPRKGPSTSI